jgi:hypothetical protein
MLARVSAFARRFSSGAGAHGRNVLVNALIKAPSCVLLLYATLRSLQQ